MQLGIIIISSVKFIALWAHSICSLHVIKLPIYCTCFEHENLCKHSRQSGLVRTNSLPHSRQNSLEKILHERMKNGGDNQKENGKVFGAFSDFYSDKWHLGELQSNSVFIVVCSWIDINSHFEKNCF